MERLIVVDSECQAHAELNISGHAGGIGNLADLRGDADVGSGNVEVRVVHNIEKFSAELEVNALGDTEPLINRLVPIDDAGPPQRIARRVSIGEPRGHG